MFFRKCFQRCFAGGEDRKESGVSGKLGKASQFNQINDCCQIIIQCDINSVLIEKILLQHALKTVNYQSRILWIE